VPDATGPTGRAGPESAGPPPELLARLRARADADGFVPFDAFEDVALYAPGVGYYERERSPFGPAGDFYTAPGVHPLFARALAARLSTFLRPLGEAARIVELGPGDGRLAEGLIPALGSSGSGPKIEYVLVERSVPLASQALARARAAAVGTGVTVRSSPALAADGPFSGAVVANELLDALPARRLRWTGREWRELGVRIGGDRLVPADGPVRDPVPGRPLPAGIAPGTEVELSTAGEGIVREVADHLVGGAFVVLDYGMGESELVAAHPRGTLAAVRRHRTVADPLSAPAATDLSVFVNFDRVRDAARAAGLVELAYRSQAEALGAWGFPELLASAVREARSSEAEVRLRLVAKSLLFGFDRFRALELGAPGPRARGSAPA
jgi:SAM-dependent MidA family methyltransferase